MAYTNLSKLNDIQAINMSFDNLTTVQGATQQLQDSATSTVGNFWFYGSIFLIFLMLIWWFYRPDKSFLLDMTRSIFISSAWCLFISIAFLLSGWINTILPIIWFTTIFTINLISLMRLKEKGL